MKWESQGVGVATTSGTLFSNFAGLGFLALHLSVVALFLGFFEMELA